MMSENVKKDHRVNGVRIGYTDKKITSYGGYSLLAMYFEKIGLKAVLNQLMPIEQTSPNAMSGAEKLLGFMSTVIAGGRRFSHVMYLGNLEAIKAVFGLDRLPLAGSTLTRYGGQEGSKKGYNSNKKRPSITPSVTSVFEWKTDPAEYLESVWKYRV